MPDNYQYPPLPNNIFAYQDADVVYATTLYEDDAGETARDLTGYTLTAYFYRIKGETALGSVTAVNNTAVVTGQVIVTVADGSIGEHSLDTIGYWDLYGTKGTITKVYDWGSFNVKDNGASA